MNSPLAWIRQLMTLMLVLSASMTFGSVVHAQEEKGLADDPAEEKESPQQKMMAEMMKRQIDGMKKTYEAGMAVRIQEMASVCKLTDAQVRQLRLAAKGSIVKALDDQKQRMERMQAFMAEDMDVNFVAGQPMEVNVVVDAVAEGDAVVAVPAAPAVPAKPVEAEKPVEPDEPEESATLPAKEEPDGEPKAEAAVAMEEPIAVVGQAMAVDFAMGMPFMGSEDGESTPWKQPIWVETVKATLTDEQAKTLEAFEKERTVRTQKTRIQSFVQSIDTELHLNEKQREDLKAWMEKDYASYFTDPNTEYLFSGPGLIGSGFFLQVDDGQPQPKADPEHFAVVSKILSPEQMELWKVGYGKTFQTLENMKRGGPEGGFGIQQILAPFR